MLHGWSCYYAHVWRTLAEQEERETDLGTGNINGSRNTQKEFSLVAVLHQPSKHHRSLKLPLQRMFVSFQIILESRISDKWYTFRSESTILEYFKFCKPFLKPSPPKTSSSTHLSCFTNYKLLHKERLLDVQNHPFFMAHPHQTTHSVTTTFSCPAMSSLLLTPSWVREHRWPSEITVPTMELWDQKQCHDQTLLGDKRVKSILATQGSTLLKTLMGGKRVWDKIRLSLLTWDSDDLRIISKQN